MLYYSLYSKDKPLLNNAYAYIGLVNNKNTEEKTVCSICYTAAMLIGLSKTVFLGCLVINLLQISLRLW